MRRGRSALLIRAVAAQVGLAETATGMRVLLFLILLGATLAYGDQKTVATLTFRHLGPVTAQAYHGIPNAIPVAGYQELTEGKGRPKPETGIPASREMQLLVPMGPIEKQLEKALAKHDVVAKAVIYFLGGKAIHKIVIQNARLAAVTPSPGQRASIMLFYTSVQEVRT